MPPGPRRPALAGEALSGLEDAVLEGSPERAGDLADADDSAARDQLVALAENAASAEVAEFSLRYVDELGGVAEDGTWQAAVDTSWAFRGFDPTPALAEVRFGFRVDGDRAVITSVGGGDRRSPLWMTTPLVVRRDAGTLVLVAGDAREADRFEALAQAAVPAVHGVLPRWRPRLVVEVPPTLAALHGALDSDPGQYDAVAAVTSTADGSLTPDGPVHVFVNPEVFGNLKPRGAQVVMSHEAVHVATDAAISTMPLWLLEGFADYVALRDVHLPVSVTAGQIIRQVRADGPPAQLPGQAEFDTATTHLGASYESAWLACRLLADVGGQTALVDFYRAVDAGAEVDAALRSEFGFGRARAHVAMAGPARGPRRMSDRTSRPDARVGVAVTLVGGVALLVLAVVLVPWNPVPGGMPDPTPAGDVFTPEQIAAAEQFSRWARVWGWSALAVSMAVACWLGFTSTGRRLVERLPGRWWAQVVLGVAALSLIGRLATLPLGYAAYRHLVDYGLSTQSVGAWLLDVAKGELVGDRGDIAGAAGAGRLRPTLAARLARGRRRGAGGGRAGRLVRLPGAGRAAVQRLPLVARRVAADPDPRARRPGGRGGGRRAGGGRLAAYDDPERLRVRLRRHPTGRGLRQPRRGPARGQRPCRWSPTSSRTPGTATW